MKVVIASINPVKKNAVAKAFEKVFPNESFDFELTPFPSEVSDQPMSDQETFDGANNRAKNAQEAIPDADFWVGIEGGLEEKRGELELFAWIIVINKEGTIGKGRTSTLFLPSVVAEKVLSGGELGPVTDEVFNKKDSKKDQGIVGILTHDLVKRTEYYVDPTIMALIPFVNEDLYNS